MEKVHDEMKEVDSTIEKTGEDIVIEENQMRTLKEALAH